MRREVERHDPTATAVLFEDNREYRIYRVIWWALVVGIVAIVLAMFVNIVRLTMAQRVWVESANIKGTMVLNCSGEIVDWQGVEGELFGKDVTLMLPVDRIAEAKRRMRVDNRVTLDIPMGRVQLAKSNEGRWLGVVR